MNLHTQSERRSCAIIGAGVSGSMCALVMERLGWDVTLYDRADPLGSGHGAYIIGAKTSAALDKFGISVVQLGTPLKLFSGYDFDGRLKWCKSVRYIKDKCGYPLCYIGRNELIGAFHSAAPRVRKLFNTQIQSLSLNTPTATIEVAGREVESFDLVVIADGVRSSHRSSVSDEATLVNLPFFGLVGHVKDDFTTLYPGQLVDKINGSDRMVFIRSGDGGLYFKLSSFVDNPEVLESCRKDKNFARDFAVERFAYGSSPEINALLNRIATHQEEMLTFTGEHVLSQHQAWRHRRGIVIGDAAHAMTPALGQGANQAVMDAIELGKALLLHDQIEPALQAFERDRKRFLEPVSALSTCLTMQYAPEDFSSKSVERIDTIPNAISDAEAENLLETLGFR